MNTLLCVNPLRSRNRHVRTEGMGIGPRQVRVAALSEHATQTEDVLLYDDFRCQDQLDNAFYPEIRET